MVEPIPWYQGIGPDELDELHDHLIHWGNLVFASYKPGTGTILSTALFVCELDDLAADIECIQAEPDITGHNRTKDFS